MQIQFRSHAPAAARLRRHGLARLREALRHLEWRIARVIVRFEYVGHGVGRVNKRCSFELVMNGADSVAVIAEGRSWQDSFDAAVAQVRRRVVMRMWQVAAGPDPSNGAEAASAIDVQSRAAATSRCTSG